MSTKTVPAESSQILPSPSRLLTWGKRYWAVAVAFSAVLLIGLPTLIVPLYTDQATFALAARNILDGGVPYRDIWDIKPPGIYFTYALSFLALGEHMASVRVLDLLNTAGAMVAVYLLGRRLFSERAGVFAGCLYGFTYLTRSGFDGLGQTESFFALPVALALFLYEPSPVHAGRRRALASGLLLGLAFSIKFSAGLFVLALPAMELLWSERPWRLRPAIERLTVAAAGFLAVQALWLGYLMAAGALDDFIDIQRLYVADYTTLRWSPEGQSYPEFLGNTLRWYFESTLYLFLPAIAVLFLALMGDRPKQALLSLLLVVVALLGVWGQGKFLPYHWLALVFPLSLPAGYAFDRAFAFFATTLRGRRALLATGLLGVSLLALTPSIVGNSFSDYGNFVGFVTGSVSKEENEERHSEFLRVNHDLVDYIKATSGDDESFFLWGQWPIAYWWANRPPASRFVYETGLRATWSPKEWRMELADDVRREQPQYFVVASSAPQPWLVGNDASADQQLLEYPDLISLLNEDYREVEEFVFFRVYKRLDATTRSAPSE